MGKSLYIAEKPSVAQEFAKASGGEVYYNTSGYRTVSYRCEPTGLDGSKKTRIHRINPYCRLGTVGFGHFVFLRITDSQLNV